MSFDDAIRLTEMLLAFAFMQQSIEHLNGAKDEQRLFVVRLILSLLLFLGVQPALVCGALVGVGLYALHRFQGPYNGGSDRMGLLLLCGLALVHILPALQWQEYVLGYVALQVVLSYFMAGWVKIVNQDWRNGRALQNVFLFSAYPVSENLRSLAQRPQLLRVMAWAVMGFEVLFPLSLYSQQTLIAALVIAAIFHGANACLFGLNRFFWVWIAAYPSVIWLQHRIFIG